MTNMVKSGNAQHPNILTIFLQYRSFINQDFVNDLNPLLLEIYRLSIYFFMNLLKNCSLHPLKKEFYLKITFLEFIHFRVNILIMIIKTYLFEIRFMKNIGVKISPSRLFDYDCMTSMTFCMIFMTFCMTS